MRFKHCFYYFLVAFSLLASCFEAQAQFFYDEPGRHSSGIFQMNGSEPAYYTGTATNGDPAPEHDFVGQGWIRLTKAKKDQLGYVVLDKTFPTTMGVAIEFDFIVWGSYRYYDGSAGTGQADGFCVYLIDATKKAGAFDQGGCRGGGLGFVGNLSGSPRGAQPTYLGVGLDVRGFFSSKGAENPGAHGCPFLPNQQTPNFLPDGQVVDHAVALRTGSIQRGGDSAYRYLIGTGGKMAVLYSAQQGGAQTNIGNGSNRYLSHDTSAYLNPSVRPANYYNRARINFDPLANGGVKVTVNIKFKNAANFLKLFEYNYQPGTLVFKARPDTMRVAFSASTGGQAAFHDIRNVLIRTPGVLTIAKQPVECPSVGSVIQIQTTVGCISDQSNTQITVVDTLPQNFSVTGGNPITINQGSQVNGVITGISTTTTGNRQVYTYTLNMGTYENIHVTYTGKFTTATGQFTTGAGITNVNPPITLTPGQVQVTHARYTGATKYLAAGSPAEGAVSYVKGGALSISVVGGDLHWEYSLDNGTTWTYAAGNVNPFTPSAELRNLPSFKLRCISGTGACATAPLEYTCTARIEPDIVLADSCSRQPYLTVKYMNDGASYQWFKAGATGVPGWSQINGATNSKLYITEDGQYKVRVTYGGMSGDSRVRRCYVKKYKLNDFLWWYEIYSEYN